MDEGETIVAPATAVGESAIALVRLSGPLARPLADGFARGRPPPSRRVWHRHYLAADGGLIDDVLFCFFEGPSSYTGEDVLEISCHGNPLIVRRIVDDLVGRGCRLAEPGEFTRRGFLNGKMDLTSAEAVIDVIRARSDRALDAAQRQLRGELGRRIESLVDRVLRTCAAIEAYIDFPEEDLPGEDRAARIGELDRLLGEIRGLRMTQRHHELLHEGVRVVLLGEPNAGKSSLMNRFAGYERAIVSALPGTTRDFLEEGVLIGPHRIRIVDTAGLREAGAEVERAGVRQTQSVAERADVFLLVVDATMPFPTLPAGLSPRLRADNTVIVRNKIDLPHELVLAGAAPGIRLVNVSTLFGTGLEDLNRAIVEVVDGITATGTHDEGVAVNLRHARALEETALCLSDGRELLRSGDALELIGSALRGAVSALERIVGRIDNEAMLDRLFAEFCIGK